MNTVPIAGNPAVASELDEVAKRVACWHSLPPRSQEHAKRCSEYTAVLNGTRIAACTCTMVAIIDTTAKLAPALADPGARAPRHRAMCT